MGNKNDNYKRQMDLEEFFNYVGDKELFDGILNTVCMVLNGDSVSKIIKLMETHNIDKLIGNGGWELARDGTFYNPYTKLDYRKGQYDVVLDKVYCQEKLVRPGIIFDRSNNLINTYYINPHFNPFDYLKSEKTLENDGILTLSTLSEYLRSEFEENEDLKTKQYFINDMNDNEFIELMKKLKTQNFHTRVLKKIFISHSFKDRKIAKGIALAFLNLGYDPFLDWVDAKNLDRKLVNAKTALTIKDHINNSSIFVYIASKSHGHSKWMPWELGISFGQEKYTFILPADEEIKKGGYAGQEYLRIHDHLIFDKGKFYVYKNGIQSYLLSSI